MASNKKFENVASIVNFMATPVAILALVVSFYTWYETTNIQRRTAAFTYWQMYLQSALANPEFASGVVNEADPVEKQKYEWFVANALGTAEAVYVLQEGDEGWRATIKTVIRTHKEYIESPAFERQHYSDSFLDLVDETLQEP
jgi:hypothetical protein